MSRLLSDSTKPGGLPSVYKSSGSLVQAKRAWQGGPEDSLPDFVLLPVSSSPFCEIDRQQNRESVSE